MGLQFLQNYQLKLLSILRIVVALLFLQHATAKLFGYPAPMMTGHLPPLLLAAGIIELVESVLIGIGLFTRIAAFICSGEMAVAYWLYHVGQSGQWIPLLNQGDEAILYCFVFLYIAAAGPGPWSIDRS
ncbi:MAG: DoxX family protein [Alphaproteobacteria bacterium]|nr:DoxX family protein [Alphaproteobacteria bacterium]